MLHIQGNVSFFIAAAKLRIHRLINMTIENVELTATQIKPALSKRFPYGSDCSSSLFKIRPAEQTIRFCINAMYDEAAQPAAPEMMKSMCIALAQLFDATFPLFFRSEGFEPQYALSWRPILEKGLYKDLEDRSLVGKASFGETSAILNTLGIGKNSHKEEHPAQ
jgi:hypothetical protein